MNEEVDFRDEMSPEDLAKYYQSISGYGEQDENGIDISLLRANLKLTPTERIEKMRRAAKFIREIRNAGIRSRLANNPPLSDSK